MRVIKLVVHDNHSVSLKCPYCGFESIIPLMEFTYKRFTVILKCGRCNWVKYKIKYRIKP